MTREAKIGLLTGLGVIVLIGVLLSNYLGGPGGTAGAGSAPVRMAELPIGSAYRERVMQPVVVPGAQVPVNLGMQTTAVSPPAMGNSAGDLPPAYAAIDPGQGGVAAAGNPPVLGIPVRPLPDGRIAALPVAGGDVPVIRGDAGAGGAGAGAVPGSARSGEEYVIAPGDTLSKIAKKYYQSAKPEDVKRIIAANPGTLKDVTTMLIVGKKLLIPLLPKAAVTTAAAPARTDATRAESSRVVISAPGGGDATGRPGSGQVLPDGARPEAVRWYTVVQGDTLEKIGRKLGAKNAGEFVKQVSALNKITDPHGLKIGMKLKLPGKE